MMEYLEPCCYNKQLGELIDYCKGVHLRGNGDGCINFFSNSDWDALQLINTMAAYAEGGELHIAMINLNYELADCVRKLLAKTRVNPMDRSQTLPYINRVYLLTQPGAFGRAETQRQSVRDLLGKYIEEDRLTVGEANIGFRCIAASSDKHNIVVQGSLNAQKSDAVQMFSLTTTYQSHKVATGVISSLCRTHNAYRALTHEIVNSQSSNRK